MDYKVVMTFEYPGLPPDEKVLTDIGAQFAKIPCKSGDELIAAAHDADAIITGLAAQPLFTRKVIEGLNKCRIISSLGIGYEGVDLDAATERGIYVTNVPDYCLEEVTDHSMAILLACARKLFRLDKAVREGKWDSLERPQIRYQIWPPMFRISGQTLGLIGFGNVPRALVPKAKGFGLKVIAYDPYASPGIAEEMGVELVDVDRLLQESDYVSVHAALTAETRHMLGLEQFKKMKPTAYLINAARGPLVDESALYTALAEGHIAGAGLDVTDPEPPSLDNPLFKLDNVIFTAHSAYYSESSTLELLSRPVEEVVSVLTGRPPRKPLNPQAKKRFLHRWGKG